MKKLRVHVLYEHGPELHSQCSGHIRLLRPLSHPSVRERVELTAGRRYEPGAHDVVVVERLWHPGLTLAQAERLIEEVRRSGARLVYAQDDNILDLRVAQPEWDLRFLTDERIAIMELFAQEADGILTTTEPLRARLARYNRAIAVVPNALDERLICAQPGDRALRAGRPITIGYMGTRSHDEDLPLIAPALRHVCRRWGDAVAVEIVGAVASASSLERLAEVPFRVVEPPPAEADYPLFFPWFTRTIAWDIGLAPLANNVYTACKSDIKLLDYAAIGAAGVFSRCPPYASIPDDVLGVIVDDAADAWTAALERLIEDAATRHAIADAATQHLFGERLLAQRARDFVAALETLAA